MKRKSLLWSLTAATVMFFASCNNENIPQTGGEDATVNFYVVPTLGISDTEDGSEAESKITTLEAYIFEGETQLSYASQNVESQAKSITLIAKKGISLTVAVVANSNIGSVASLTELKGKLSTHVFSNSNSTTIPSNGFVMSYMEEGCIFNLDANNKAISLKRSVAKFDAPKFDEVKVDLTNVPLNVIQTIFPAYKDENRVDDITFSYKGFYLANGLDKSKLFSAAAYAPSLWPAKENARPTWIDETIKYIKSEFASEQMTSAYSGNSFIPANNTTTKVYVHENYPYDDKVVNGVTGYDPLEVYCFIVKGTLTWNNNTSEDRYWRINLVRETLVNPTDDYYRIFRNGYYKVEVEEVNTIGHETPEDAEKEVPVIPKEGEASVTITVTPAPWDIIISETNI